MPHERHSKALERCLEYTKEKGEIVGLLSYSLYKASLREAAQSKDGHVPQSHERNLTHRELKQLSITASKMLADYADQQYPESERTNIEAIKHLEKRLTAYPPAIIKGFIVSFCVLSIWVFLNLAFHGWSSLGLIRNILFPTS